jgi:hypothetical protein
VNEERVLRITTERNENSLSLKLEGRVDGPWVDLLRKAWTDATSRARHQEIVADFGGVSFVDPEGRKLLLTMEKRGATLVNLSGFLRQVLGHDASNLSHNNADDDEGE